MHHKILLRWIAEAEARWFESFALLIREPAEPKACIIVVAGPTRLARLSRLAARLCQLIRSRSHDSPGPLSPAARLTPDE